MSIFIRRNRLLHEASKARQEVMERWKLHPDDRQNAQSEARLDRMAGHLRAIWSIACEEYGWTGEVLRERMQSLKDSERPRTCTGCGRTLSAHHRSCPYCGAPAQAGADDAGAVDGSGTVGAAADVEAAQSERPAPDRLEQRMNALALAQRAIWSLIAEEKGIPPERLTQRIEELAAARTQALLCTVCARPLAARQPKCLYCGSPKPASAILDDL